MRRLAANKVVSMMMMIDESASTLKLCNYILEEYLFLILYTIIADKFLYVATQLCALLHDMKISLLLYIFCLVLRRVWLWQSLKIFQPTGDHSTR